MCIILNTENIVISISFIPGADLNLPDGYTVIFPWQGETPCKGDKLNEEEIEKQLCKTVIGEI